MATDSITARQSDDEAEADDERSDSGETKVSRFPPRHLTEWGEPMDVGNGEVKTFVTFNSADMPMFVGLHLTADALDDLGDEHEHFSLQFPDSIEETAFEWVGFHWGPGRHGPPGVYDVPHFDMHFYLLPE